MVKINIGGAHLTTAEIVHGNRSMNSLIPLSPMEYASMLDSGIHINTKLLEMNPRKGAYITCPNKTAKIQFGAQVYSNDELVTMRKIFRDMSKSIRNDFFPNWVAVAYPVARGYYYKHILKTMHRMCESRFAVFGTPFKIAPPNQSATTFAPAMSNKNYTDVSNGHHLLTIPMHYVEYPTAHTMILLGIDPMLPYHNRDNFIIDEDLEQDPMIMLIHPLACWWYDHDERLLE